MKTLSRVLLLAGMLSTPLLVSTAQGQANSERPKSFYSIFVGSFSAQSNSLKERYGRSTAFGGGVGSEIVPGLAVGGNVAYIADEGAFPGAPGGSHMSMLDVSLRLDYIIPFQEGRFYIGGDGSLIKFSESATVVTTTHSGGTYHTTYEDGRVSATNFGGGIHAGVDISLDAGAIFIETCIKSGEEKSGGDYLTLGFRGNF